MLKHVGDKHKAEREDEDKIKFSELADIDQISGQMSHV